MMHIQIRNFIEELQRKLGTRNVDGRIDSDEKIEIALGLARNGLDRFFAHGLVLWELTDEDGLYKTAFAIPNLITRVGDQYYGERAAGIASPPGQVTGMRLGTGGATGAAKTGAGAAIVTYLAGSQKAIDGGFPTSALNSESRRITWKSSWSAGQATGNGINEAVITNESPLTDVAGTASNTIARADNTLITPTVNKAAGDTLAITWYHDLLGA